MSEGNTDMSIFTGIVEGMTCQHCVASVTEEVAELPGVTDVSVDLASGTLRVTSDVPLAQDDVAGAVAEAGYALR